MRKTIGGGLFAVLFLAGFAVSAVASDRISFGFSLSGGLNSMGGGDLNSVIRDTTTLFSDYNDYYGSKIYTSDLKELKWLKDIKLEFFVRFGRYLGVGAGVEALWGKSPGTFDYKNQYSIRYPYSTYYDDDWVDDQSSETLTPSLTVVPITLNFYGFFPVGSKINLFGYAGAGLYLGWLNYDYVESGAYKGGDNYYYNSGSTYYPWYYYEDKWTYNETLKWTCATVGFQFGVGGQFKLASFIAIFGQISYRYANFNNWTGTDNWDSVDNYKSGWTNTPGTGPNVSSSSDSGSIAKGKAWYYQYYASSLKTKSYGSWGFYDQSDYPNGPSATSSMKNVRAFSVKLDGFSFQIGISFRFGPT